MLPGMNSPGKYIVLAFISPPASSPKFVHIMVFALPREERSSMIPKMTSSLRRFIKMVNALKTIQKIKSPSIQKPNKPSRTYFPRFRITTCFRSSRQPFNWVTTRLVLRTKFLSSAEPSCLLSLTSDMCTRTMTNC